MSNPYAKVSMQKHIWLPPPAKRLPSVSRMAGRDVVTVGKNVGFVTLSLYKKANENDNESAAIGP